MPLWNYAEMGGPDRYNEKWIKQKHLTSQQKSRPAKNFIVEALEEGQMEASQQVPNHRTTFCVFFSDSIFSFGTLLNIPKPLAVVCIQPHKDLVEKSDVWSHHPTRDFLLGYLASTYIAGFRKMEKKEGFLLHRFRMPPIQLWPSFLVTSWFNFPKLYASS